MIPLQGGVQSKIASSLFLDMLANTISNPLQYRQQSACFYWQFTQLAEKNIPQTADVA